MIRPHVGLDFIGEVEVILQRVRADALFVFATVVTLLVGATKRMVERVRSGVENPRLEAEDEGGETGFAGDFVGVRHGSNIAYRGLQVNHDEEKKK